MARHPHRPTRAAHCAACGRRGRTETHIYVCNGCRDRDALVGGRWVSRRGVLRWEAAA